jgi:hypothetical protein
LSKIIFIVTVNLTFNPKINRVLPLPQGNHVVKFGKVPIYRTKVMRKRPCCHTFFVQLYHGKNKLIFFSFMSVLVII